MRSPNLAHHYRTAKGQHAQQIAARHLCRESVSYSTAIAQGNGGAIGTSIRQHGVCHNHAAQALSFTARIHAIRQTEIMAAHNAAAVFRKRFGKLCDQGAYLRIRRCIGHKLHGAAAPAHRNAGRIERHMQIAKIHGRPLCRNHKNGVSLRRTLHNRIRPLFRVWPKKTMRMPAHNHVHPFHRTGQAAIFRQTEMRESDNMVYALLFQFLYRAGQNLFALLEAGGRTGCRQFHNFIIGKADDCGVCLLLVHHTRKQQADDKFDMISGTNGLLGAADGAFLLQKEKRTDGSAVLDVAGRDQQDQRFYLTRDKERLIWTLERTETEAWTEPPDPVLEAIAALVTAEKPTWGGTATELVAALQTDMKPNALAMRLNVRAGKLLIDYHIRYENSRSHAGRSISLTLEPSQA